VFAKRKYREKDTVISLILLVYLLCSLFLFYFIFYRSLLLACDITPPQSVFVGVETFSVSVVCILYLFVIIKNKKKYTTFLGQ